jgi:hypothetical protein
MTVHDPIPDSVKVVVAGSAPMASLFGLTVEEWSFVLSGVVALLFIVEKLFRGYLYLRRKKNESCTRE